MVLIELGQSAFAATPLRGADQSPITRADAVAGLWNPADLTRKIPAESCLCLSLERGEHWTRARGEAGPHRHEHWSGYVGIGISR